MESTLITPRIGKLSIYKKNLTYLMTYRTSEVYTVTGKDKGRAAWHVLLVDHDKIDEFLNKCRSGSCDVADYGKIASSGFGEKEDVPEKILNGLADNEIELKFHIFVEMRNKFQYFYYKLVDETIQDFNFYQPIANQIRKYRTLHSGWGKEVPDAIPDLLVIAGLKSEHRFEDKYDSTNVFSFAREGELEKIKSYINGKHSIDVTDNNGWSLLHHAAFGGSLQVVQFLMEKNASLNARDRVCGRKPVYIAAREGHSDVVKHFLRHNKEINAADNIGWTLLHYAAWSGNLELVELLIEKNADIHAKDLRHGKKPLHVCAREDHTELVKLFLKKFKMNIEDKDTEGRTPLYYTVWGGGKSSFKFLVQEGANINIKNVYGVSLAHIACDRNSIEVLECLLAMGCNMEEKNTNGQTPLLWAVMGNALECLKILIEKGVDVNVVVNNETLLDIAKDHHNTQVVSFLTAKQYEMERNYAKSLEEYQKLFNLQKDLCGLEDLDILWIYDKIACLHTLIGMHVEAGKIHREIHELKKRKLGADHPDTLDSQHNIASALESQCFYTDAGCVYQDVFHRRRKVLSADHPATLQTQHDLATILSKKGEHEKALCMFKELYGRRKNVLGESHVDTLRSLQEIGVVLTNLGREKEALNVFKDLFEKRKDLLGIDHPETLLAKHSIGCLTEFTDRETKGCFIQ